MTEEERHGILDLDRLWKMVERGEIETVVVSFPDLYGRLQGKRVRGGVFFPNDVSTHGINACDYPLTSDMEMNPVSEHEFASWEKGYGDILCDLATTSGVHPIEIAPRTILAWQVKKVRVAGFLPKGAAELEMFIFGDTYEEAHEKKFDNLRPFANYIEDYHILQTCGEGLLVGVIRNHLQESGIPFETSKGEWEKGQHEINIHYCDLLEMGDRTVLFKEICKETAIKRGFSLTFMAKWNENAAGNSMHIHSSLWDADEDKSLFVGNERLPGLPVTSPPFFRWYLGGLLARVRELTLFFASNVNSYKRYQEGAFAPMHIAWAYDNRSVGFHVLGRADSLRVECRLTGADANPYLALSAILAAGLDGIKNKIEPPPTVEGNAYLTSQVSHIAKNITQAREAFEKSEFARDAFGRDVVRHYVQFAYQEEDAFA